MICFVALSNYCFGSDLTQLQVPDSLISNNQVAKKGMLDICLSFPFLNTYNLNVDSYGKQSGGGFDGLAGSLDYYYRDNQFLSLSLNGILTYESPLFFLGTDQIQKGVYQFFYSAYWGLTNNYKLGKINIGYGLSLSKDYWIWQNIDNGETRERNSQSIGLMFPINVMLGKSFYIGVIYRPTIYQISPDRHFNFENLISFGFGMRYQMKKNNGR